MGIELGIHGTADEHDNHYTVRGLAGSGQKKLYKRHVIVKKVVAWKTFVSR